MVSKLKHTEPHQLDYRRVPEFRNLSQSNPAKACAQSGQTVRIVSLYEDKRSTEVTLFKDNIVVTCRDLGRKIGTDVKAIVHKS